MQQLLSCVQRGPLTLHPSGGAIDAGAMTGWAKKYSVGMHTR